MLSLAQRIRGSDMHGAAETLLIINIAAVHGIVVMQTIWATTADLVTGHRLTRSEILADDAALFRRRARAADRRSPARSHGPCRPRSARGCVTRDERARDVAAVSRRRRS
jgi:hypothetical protein